MFRTFNKSEESWLSRLEKVLSSMPDTLRMYGIDGGNVTICKVGVPANDLERSVDVNINFGAMLTDLHDKEDYGEYGE